MKTFIAKRWDDLFPNLSEAVRWRPVELHIGTESQCYEAIGRDMLRISDSNLPKT